jgi:hypothetical protein
VGLFGTASPAAPIAVLGEAVPKAIPKQLHQRSSRNTHSLERFGTRLLACIWPNQARRVHLMVVSLAAALVGRLTVCN